MSEVYYWVLCHDNWPRHSPEPCYFAFINAGTELPTDPARAMRWLDLEGVEQFASHLLGDWTPKLIAFDGAALCGGVEKQS